MAAGERDHPGVRGQDDRREHHVDQGEAALVPLAGSLVEVRGVGPVSFLAGDWTGDWVLAGDSLVHDGFSISVGFEIDFRHVEAIALLTGMDVGEVSQYLDTHIERGEQ
jgi:hypothetical protein